VVQLPARTGNFEQLLDVVAEELNVKAVELAGSAEAFGRWHAKPDFTVLGPRLGSAVQAVAAALASDDGRLADRLAAGEPIELDADGATVSVGPHDVRLTRDARPGLGVATEGGVTVALELDVTPELRREGVARELVRLVQDARKAAGLEITDRIELAVEASGDVAAALDAHRDEIAGETLATMVDRTLDGFRQEEELDGTTVVVALRKAG
jgi:isoleucyl-tRNA synthetase